MMRVHFDLLLVILHESHTPFRLLLDNKSDFSINSILSVVTDLLSVLFILIRNIAQPICHSKLSHNIMSQRINLLQIITSSCSNSLEELLLSTSAS